MNRRIFLIRIASAVAAIALAPRLLGAKWEQPVVPIEAYPNCEAPKEFHGMPRLSGGWFDRHFKRRGDTYVEIFPFEQLPNNRAALSTEYLNAPYSLAYYSDGKKMDVVLFARVVACHL